MSISIGTIGGVDGRADSSPPPALLPSSGRELSEGSSGIGGECSPDSTGNNGCCVTPVSLGLSSTGDTECPF